MIIEEPLTTQPIERRAKPRIDCSYPAIVQGLDADGRKFRTNATLTNLSASGLHLVLNKEVPAVKDLFVVFKCSSTGPLGEGKAPLIAVGGKIVRSHGSAPGSHALALKIRSNRFL